MRHVTLCFPIEIDDGKITNLWLGMKKRGFGAGKWNGFGGKLDEGETIEEATVRELREESGLETKVEYLIPVATLQFVFADNPDWDQIVHVFFTNTYKGDPTETDEMRPCYFDANDLPYESMWPDDVYWLPIVLRRNSGNLNGEFIFDKTGKYIQEMVLRCSMNEG